ncbi:MAG: UDP-N-acetylglucosamine 1-carboxyvinyltransferase [Mailhella sp.]|nr:UDP-N-acetylglucosamine 1-carboxyvinyltransferase [Mailhella sp.]
MDVFVIEGGVPLKGNVRISGAKNAALPILFSSILFDEPLEFHNIPVLRDINTTLKLLSVLGLKGEQNGDVVKIVPGTLNPEAPYDLVKTMRASILCLGPLMARHGSASVAMPGGCAIGARPVDLHLSALEQMGARFVLEEGYIRGRCDRLRGAHIRLDFPTVTGTENILMAACFAEGVTVLENVAREPEVTDLANFLIACGAKISGAGSQVITVEGVDSLKPVPYSIISDRIEAGTYMVAAAITDGDMVLENCPLNAMDALTGKLSDAGVSIEAGEDGSVRVRRSMPLLSAVDVTTRPYPGFPTDMQAQFMSMMALSRGSGIIEETIFENRFMHVPELIRMGADIKISGSAAVVRGVNSLHGAPVMGSDLRAGAALVLAGLAAEGHTKVQRVYHLDRGYEKMEVKLQALGARISRVHEDD